MGKSEIPKTVQIPLDTFIQLWDIFCGNWDDDIRWDLLDEEPNHVREIQDALNTKMESLVRRIDYASWHDANLTDEDREQARQRYLDAVGMHPDWRW